MPTVAELKKTLRKRRLSDKGRKAELEVRLAEAELAEEELAEAGKAGKSADGPLLGPVMTDQTAAALAATPTAEAELAEKELAEAGKAGKSAGGPLLGPVMTDQTAAALAAAPTAVANHAALAGPQVDLPKHVHGIEVASAKHVPSPTTARGRLIRQRMIDAGLMPASPVSAAAKPAAAKLAAAAAAEAKRATAERGGRQGRQAQKRAKSRAVDPGTHIMREILAIQQKNTATADTPMHATAGGKGRLATKAAAVESPAAQIERIINDGTEAPPFELCGESNLTLSTESRAKLVLAPASLRDAQRLDTVEVWALTQYFEKVGGAGVTGTSNWYRQKSGTLADWEAETLVAELRFQTARACVDFVTKMNAQASLNIHGCYLKPTAIVSHSPTSRAGVATLLANAMPGVAKKGSGWNTAKPGYRVDTLKITGFLRLATVRSVFEQFGEITALEVIAGSPGPEKLLGRRQGQSRLPTPLHTDIWLRYGEHESLHQCAAVLCTRSTVTRGKATLRCAFSSICVQFSQFLD